MEQLLRENLNFRDLELIEKFLQKREGTLLIEGIHSSEVIDALLKDRKREVIADLDSRDLKIKELKAELANASMTSERSKVFVIKNVHLMRSELYNAILKTLEEPIDTLFILSSSNSVPETIRSRAVSIKLMENLFKEDKNFILNIFNNPLKEVIAYFEVNDKDFENIFDILIVSTKNFALIEKGLKLKRNYNITKNSAALFLFILEYFYKK